MLTSVVVSKMHLFAHTLRVATLLMVLQSPLWAQSVNFGLTAGWAGIITTPLSFDLSEPLISGYGINNYTLGAWSEIKLGPSLHLLLEAQLASQNTRGSFPIRQQNGDFIIERGKVFEQSFQFPLLFSYHADDQASAEVGLIITHLTSSRFSEARAEHQNYQDTRASIAYGFATGVSIRLNRHLRLHGRLVRNLTGNYREVSVDLASMRYIFGQLILRWQLKGLKPSPSTP